MKARCMGTQAVPGCRRRYGFPAPCTDVEKLHLHKHGTCDEYPACTAASAPRKRTKLDNNTHMQFMPVMSSDDFLASIMTGESTPFMHTVLNCDISGTAGERYQPFACTNCVQTGDMFATACDACVSVRRHSLPTTTMTMYVIRFGLVRLTVRSHFAFSAEWAQSVIQTPAKVDGLSPPQKARVMKLARLTCYVAGVNCAPYVSLVPAAIVQWAIAKFAAWRSRLRRARCLEVVAASIRDNNCCMVQSLELTLTVETDGSVINVDTMMQAVVRELADAVPDVDAGVFAASVGATATPQHAESSRVFDGCVQFKPGLRFDIAAAVEYMVQKNTIVTSVDVNGKQCAVIVHINHGGRLVTRLGTEKNGTLLRRLTAFKHEETINAYSQCVSLCTYLAGDATDDARCMVDTQIWAPLLAQERRYYWLAVKPSRRAFHRDPETSHGQFRLTFVSGNACAWKHVCIGGAMSYPRLGAVFSFGGRLRIVTCVEAAGASTLATFRFAPTLETAADVTVSRKLWYAPNHARVCSACNMCKHASKYVALDQPTCCACMSEPDPPLPNMFFANYNAVARRAADEVNDTNPNALFFG